MGNTTTSTAAACLLAGTCFLAPALGDIAYGATTPGRTVSSVINVTEDVQCGGYFTPTPIGAKIIYEPIGQVHISCAKAATAAAWFKHTAGSSTYDTQLKIGNNTHPGDLTWDIPGKCAPLTLELGSGSQGEVVHPSSISGSPTGIDDRILVASSPSGQVSFDVSVNPASVVLGQECFMPPGVYPFPLYIGTYIT